MGELAVIRTETALDAPRGGVEGLRTRLEEIKSTLDLTQQFFREAMFLGQDYDRIPGTDKPTLLKPGAEKLAEFYGYSPTIRHIEEESERATGYYRARVTVALISRSTGDVVAEGVGEASTMESRYRYRWISEKKAKLEGLDTTGLRFRIKETSGDREYRIENEDPWSMWNTVLKMAKKRALVDAVLSATRTSGLFSQDLEDLGEWIAGGEGGDDKAAPATGGEGRRGGAESGSRAGAGTLTPKQHNLIRALASGLSISDDELTALVRERVGAASVTQLTRAQASALIDELKAKSADRKTASGGQRSGGTGAAGAVQPPLAADEEDPFGVVDEAELLVGV